jgi:hypothetical protein
MAIGQSTMNCMQRDVGGGQCGSKVRLVRPFILGHDASHATNSHLDPRHVKRKELNENATAEAAGR